MKSITVLLALFFLLFTPLFLQNFGWAFDIPRVLSGLPLVLLVIVSIVNWRSFPLSKLTKVLLFVSLFLFLIGVLKGLFYPNVTLVGVLAYTRSYWVFVLVYFLGVSISKYGLEKKAKEIVFAFFVISIPILIFEFLFKTDAAETLGYIDLANMTKEEWRASHSKSFLNLNDFEHMVLYRPTGPTGSTISYAYVLLALPLLFPVYKMKFFILWAVSFVLCFILGSKGGIVNFTMLTVFLIILKFTTKGWVVYSLAFLMPVFLSAVQILTGDNHGLGLVSGFNNMLVNPFGSGVGVGGNLSGSYFNQLDDARSLLYGSESIFGVYMTQMGWSFYLQLFLVISLILSSVHSKATLILSAVCFQIVFLGLAQEEAWSTYASIPLLLLSMSSASARRAV